jgi:hypothetical protein
LFGNEDNKNWCYYFENADLARQRGEWDKVVELWEDANVQGYHPQNAYEYFPFIEGFFYTGMYLYVEQLVDSVLEIDRDNARSLCWVIKNFEEIDTEEEGQFITKLEEDLDC